MATFEFIFNFLPHRDDIPARDASTTSRPTLSPLANYAPSCLISYFELLPQCSPKARACASSGQATSDLDNILSRLPDSDSPTSNGSIASFHFKEPLARARCSRPLRKTWPAWYCSAQKWQSTNYSTFWYYSLRGAALIFSNPCKIAV